MGTDTLIIVDDDPVFFQSVSDAVSTAGIVVLWAPSVARGLAIIDDFPAGLRPLAILVDVILPEVNGIEFMRALAQRGCNVPLFVVAGRDNDCLKVARAFGQGWGLNVVDGFLKPIAPSHLLKMLVELRAIRPVAPATRAPCILIVEDEPLTRTLAVANFAEAGYEVLEATNSEEALTILNDGRPVDLLFSDIRLPGQSGFALAIEASRVRPQVAVILTSAYTPDKGPDCAFSFLRKPYRPGDLLLTAEEALSRAAS